MLFLFNFRIFVLLILLSFSFTNQRLFFIYWRESLWIIRGRTIFLRRAIDYLTTDAIDIGSLIYVRINYFWFLFLAYSFSWITLLQADNVDIAVLECIFNDLFDFDRIDVNFVALNGLTSLLQILFSVQMTIQLTLPNN